VSAEVGAFGLEDAVAYPHQFRSSFGSFGIEDNGVYPIVIPPSLADRPSGFNYGPVFGAGSIASNYGGS